MESFIEIIGWLGAGLVVAAYILLSSQKIDDESRLYQSMNLFGALGVGIQAFTRMAWPSFTIQIVWALVALLALKNILKPHHRRYPAKRKR